MMVYNGLGNGNMIERNKARMSYVKNLSKDIVKLDKQFDDLIHSLCCNDIQMINVSIAYLFYENVDEVWIHDVIEMFNKIDWNDVEKFKYKMMKRYIDRPEKGFIWNCHNILM